MFEWQPIDTAPKDGTRILGYNPETRDDEPKIAVVYWCQTPGYPEFVPVEGDLYRKIEHEGHAWWEGGPWSPWRATHWMPLPEPPDA